MKPVTLKDFIDRSRLLHNDRYDYSLVSFTKTSDKILIVCPTHGSWDQVVAAHLRGQSCKRCFNETRRKPAVEKPDWVSIRYARFLEKATKLHGSKYDYSKVKYEASNVKILICCLTHGDFEQAPVQHLQGYGCRACFVDRKTLSQEEFVSRCVEVHGDVYDYSKVRYIGMNNKIEVVCKTHGTFWQGPDHHSRGSGCPKCATKSIGEKRIQVILQREGIEFEEQKSFPDLRSPETGRLLWFDFFIPSRNLLIEFDGIHHFSFEGFQKVSRVGTQRDFESLQMRDLFKTNYAEERGFSLLRVRYDEYRMTESILIRHLSLIGG